MSTYTTVLLPVEGEKITGRCATVTRTADTPALAAEQALYIGCERVCLVTEITKDGRAIFTYAFRAEKPPEPRPIMVAV